jgi:hypothetical protein
MRSPISHTRGRLKSFDGPENLEIETVADLPKPGEVIGKLVLRVSEP